MTSRNVRTALHSDTNNCLKSLCLQSTVEQQLSPASCSAQPPAPSFDASLLSAPAPQPLLKECYEILLTGASLGNRLPVQVCRYSYTPGQVLLLYSHQAGLPGSSCFSSWSQHTSCHRVCLEKNKGLHPVGSTYNPGPACLMKSLVKMGY